MNQLKIVSMNGQLVTDSRDVAVMIDRKHAHLLRDISGYKAVLDLNPKLDSANFFIESSYKNQNNQSYPCYQLTRKGCDMVANKMTGEKGVLFTAEYVTRFEEMEKEQNKPKSQLEILQGSINQLVEQERKIAEQDKRIESVEKRQEDITEVLSLNPTEWRKKVNNLLNKIAKSIGGFDAYKDVRNESYQYLEDRARCNLSIRLTNRKQKMALEGASKSKIDKSNKMDVIADDARLTEIYLAIVKEIAIKHNVEVKELI